MSEVTTRPLSLWITAGEPSGDIHAARLVREILRLAPETQIRGLCGPQLREAGVAESARVEDLSVMGVTEVVRHLPRIRRVLSDVRKGLAEDRPDALITVDAPSFNFRVIKTARSLGIPVYYYIPPKVWAWNTKRVRFLRENVRRMLCILPFEKDFYHRHGMDVDYVGNPLMDELDNLSSLLRLPRHTRRIGFLPGSRRRELESLLPEFGKAAKLLADIDPALEFSLIRAPGVSEEDITSRWPEDVPVTILPSEDRYRRMRSCTALVAASGTVTLEAALLGVPTAICYKVSALTAIAARKLLKVSFVGLPNLILNEPLFPELLQEKATAEHIAAQVMSWVRDPHEMERIECRLAELRDRVGGPGAADRSARTILSDLTG